MDPTILAMLMGGAQSNRSPQSAGISQILNGIFSRSGAPYQAGMDELEKYMNQAKDTQNPFYKAGTAAIPKYQDWLSKMSDPAKFMNDLSSQYTESPFAKYQKDQGIRAATNMGSATGLTDSTPLTQFVQQNARDITSQDQNSWLQRALGINTEYGAGQKSMVDTGQHSADMISQILSQLAGGMAEGAYGKRAGQETDKMNIINGASSFLFG